MYDTVMRVRVISNFSLSFILLNYFNIVTNIWHVQSGNGLFGARIIISLSFKVKDI